MTAGDGFLEVEGLTKEFGTGRHRVVAVDDVSFSLKKGQVASLLGESGSGKTTVARMILRLTSPTRGSIRFKGRDLATLRGREEIRAYWSDVQAVFQDPFASFNVFFKVRRALEIAERFSGRAKTAAEREERIRDAMASVGLNSEELLDKYPHELSGGQRQRVMIARALLVDSELLIADEPTSMIDASSRVSILNVLLDINRKLGMTILFITHDIGLAYYTSDYLLIMSKGKLVERGPADQVAEDPKHAYTKRLLADVPRLHEPWII